MNKYDPKELNAAIEEAISKGIKDEGMFMFIPSNEQNSDGYIDAKRFGYTRT